MHAQDFEAIADIQKLYCRFEMQKVDSQAGMSNAADS